MKKMVTFKEEKGGSSGVNFDFFTTEAEPIPLDLIGSDMDLSTKKKKKGKSVSTKRLSDGNDIILANQDESDLPLYQSNQPYLESYSETNNLLRNSVAQIDVFQNDIKTELDLIKGSKTLKKKYDYIAMLTSTASTLIGTKVTAIRELNKTITDCHNLDMKRIKDLKMSEDKVDDDKRIMDLYQAYINTPSGTYNGPTIPMNVADFTSPISASNIIRTGIAQEDPYANYAQNMSPAQNMMRLEQDSNIKTVVVYDGSTGQRWFDVMDVTTGESVPNVTKPDSMFIDDLSIDKRNGIARNTNLDITYPLIVVNDNRLAEY